MLIINQLSNPWNIHEIFSGFPRSLTWLLSVGRDDNKIQLETLKPRPNPTKGYKKGCE